jgi:heme a synthase
VGIITIAAAVLAFTRRPFWRDLAILAVPLPLGVLAQAVLGGFTVLNHLTPEFVMAHFSLSLLILVAAVALAWQATFEPGSRPRSNDRVGVWSVRALPALVALTIFAGTAATAAGPHSGGVTGQHVHRLHFKGADTLTWTVHQHAAIAARERMMEPLTVLGILLAAQGLVGSVQYELHLPSEMVWVTLATITWLTMLWAMAVAVAGRLAPRTVAVRADSRAGGTESRELELASRLD